MTSPILLDIRDSVAYVTLNRPEQANVLNDASGQALIEVTRQLADAQARGEVRAVLLAALGPHFCAGGDIRFFHQAALAGDAALEEFFTEEYTLNHLIQTYPKPYIAFMDGVVMGGGMGLSQGARARIVTEHTKMAMPETNIGLFPDVGGGYFLSRCPGHVGEYLALTGEVIGADEAINYGLADVKLEAAVLPALWAELGATSWASATDADQWIASKFIAESARPACATGKIDAYFSLLRVKHIVDALEKSEDRWALRTAATLRKRSPLMLHVVLEQIRRARGMTLADDLRMERGMVYQCFHLHPGTESETVEGIRALAVDKDYKPQWKPARIEDVKPGMADAFFTSPWTAETHPLRDL
jgi:enoyl-CoA hydratase/carnithine racemase